MGNWKRLFFGFSALLVTLSLLTFVIYLVFAYKPTKPQFSLTQISIHRLNLSGTIMESKIIINILSINPNRKARINYDEFHIYASYNDHKIAESIAPSYNQGEQETDLFSFSLSGNGVIVPPSVGYDLSRAHTYGSLRLTIIAVGRLRWKIAGWKSTRYDIEVICDCVASFQNGSLVNVPPLTTLQGCTTFL